MKHTFLFCSKAAVLAGTMLLAACQPYVAKHGYNYETLDLKKITIGKDTKTTVTELFGSPSSVSLFPTDPKLGGSRWYYISKHTSRTSFYNPETLKQQSIVIDFDKKDKVTAVSTVQGESIVPVNAKETESTGYESNAMRDVFGNFGRYSAKPPIAGSGNQGPTS